jgi:uncharacterized membrane protein
MKTRHFLSQLEHDRIVAVIRDAERKTSGEIRVYVSHRKVADALARAQRRFAKLAMCRTRHRNAVLIYIAPRSRSFAIVGDTGVHEKCGDAFWREVSAQLSHDLKNGPATDAIVHAVQTVGDLLAAHFPPSASDRDELADEVVEE